MGADQLLKKLSAASNGAVVVTNGKKSVNKRPLPSKKIVVSLTCLQFGFAVYATFLLFFMSPTIDLITHRNISWASQIVKQWSGFITGASSRNQLLEVPAGAASLNESAACEYETIEFAQKKSNDTRMLGLKKEFYKELLEFQSKTRGCETLKELMAMPSKWDKGPPPKVTVILNHFKRKTLCAQLDALLKQTMAVHSIWVVAFGSPNESKLRRIVAEQYNDTRIGFMSSSYDLKYYGRFQVALQAEGADYVYILDDDMIPGRKMIKILTHTAGTKKYSNAVLGSIGRVLPFRQKDFSFPSYRKPGAKEAGLYLPDPAYDITMNRIVQVDFLSSSWFLSAEHVKTLFIETPFTYSTGEDLHLSYQLQKYREAGSYVMPVNPIDKDSWGDSDHRLAQIAETTVIFKNVVEVRDEQWWRAMSKGYVTQWAAMHPQECDVLMYAHSVAEAAALAPLIARYYSTPGKKAFLVVSGGTYCPCEEAVKKVGWPPTACRERRFRVFDLEVGSVAKGQHSEVSLLQEIYSSMKGLLQIHNPALVIALADTPKSVADALSLATSRHSNSRTSLALLPRNSIPHALWIVDMKLDTLRNWRAMRISVNVITQNRAYSMKLLLKSLSEAYYLGDEIPLSFNMDSKVDKETLNMVGSFKWPHGPKILRRRIIQGGLIRAVSESWYPRDDHDYGLLLEDDIEVSPYYYIWLKSTLMNYHYNPHAPLPELGSIALYSPRLVEVLKERPKWNATEFFKDIHPNTPYLHQLPCSWGALFFPKHWREFYVYMGSRFTEDAKSNDVQIPKSRTNGWQASWKKFLIDMMYLRGYVTLYPNFPNQQSFSTNHMEPGAHISAADNVVKHNKEDFEVPLMKEDYWGMLPQGKLPPAGKLPVINLFNQRSSIRGLKEAGSGLLQDVLPCKLKEVVIADPATGLPDHCAPF